MGDYVYISEKELFETFNSILIKHGVGEDEAASISTVFVKNARDGVISHSVSRFPLMLSYLEKGAIKPGTMPKMESSFMAVEKWDAQSGFGITTAVFCMDRALKLAEKYGVGVVVSVNSNHWMRAGYYGHIAADRGYIGICWTTTKKNLVPWGGTEAAIGNNPVVIAVPRKEGNLVLDTSMAQYSWGQIGEHARDGKKLPTLGGYDEQGNLTDDPDDIQKTFKALSAGFWKGTAMSIILEAAACTLGQSRINYGEETSSSIEKDMTQVFIAINPKAVNEEYSDKIVNDIVERLKACPPAKGSDGVRYPGEKAKKCRERSVQMGIQIPTLAWEKLKAL